MRRASSILVLSVLLAFGASLAVPVEDIPETPYDESEGLPYESTPSFSGLVPQASVGIAKAELSGDSLPVFDSLMKRCQSHRESPARSLRVTDSPTILEHCLRC